MRVFLADGSLYYFHLNTLQGCWDEPAGFIHNSVFVDQHQIQVTHRQQAGLRDTRAHTHSHSYSHTQSS